eukprot:gene4542-4768_t
MSENILGGAAAPGVPLVLMLQVPFTVSALLMVSFCTTSSSSSPFSLALGFRGEAGSFLVVNTTAFDVNGSDCKLQWSEAEGRLTCQYWEVGPAATRWPTCESKRDAPSSCLPGSWTAHVPAQGSVTINVPGAEAITGPVCLCLT